MSATRFPDLLELIREDFAKRPEGFRCADVQGYPDRSIQNAVARGLKSGLLHRARISHRNVRFFGSARDAMECETANVQVIQYRAPTSVRWAKDIEPTNPNKVPVTKCPPCPDRWAVNSPVVGGFRALGVGRYLDGGAA